MGDRIVIMDASSPKTTDLKRSLEDNNVDSGVKKKFKTNEGPCLSSMKSFVDLSEDVLLILFSHISHDDLINLSRTCKRMDRIVRDWTLWKHINSHSAPIPMTRLTEFIPYVLECTEDVNLCFQSEIVTTESERENIENEEACICLDNFLYHLSTYCKSLSSLALEHVTVDATRFPITIFPPTLKKFSLVHSKFVNLCSDISYFYGFDTHFPRMEVLDLSWCSWFTPHSLIALSKSKKLQELYLQGCRKIKNCVPYTSLSVRFGFKALKVLDLRFTYISDSEVTIIYDLPCLSHLYLAAPTPKRLEDFAISDRSVTTLCTSSPPRNDLNGFELYEQMIGASLRILPAHESNKVVKTFHTLVVTGYPGITDISLRHAAVCLRGLRILDVRGGSCTNEAANRFRLARPEVTLRCGPDDLEPQHPPNLEFNPPSPIPLLPGLRVVLHRIENNQPNQPALPIEVIVANNNQYRDPARAIVIDFQPGHFVDPMVRAQVRRDFDDEGNVQPGVRPNVEPEERPNEQPEQNEPIEPND